MSSKRRRSSSRNLDPLHPQQTPLVQREEPAPVAPSAAPKQVAPLAGMSANHEKDRIGDILRRVREHRGEDIEAISDYLRIRPSFLAALEGSRYNEIPADTYVIGFLRTYALYLGLDGKGAIDQYRREMAGRRRAPQLSMPQPMSEGRIPTAAILVVATLACLLIYGLWYGLSTPDRSVIAQPIPLPETKAEESTPAREAMAATPAGDLLLQTTTGASAAISSLAATNEAQPQADSKPAEQKPAEQKPAPEVAPPPAPVEAAKPAPEAEAKPASYGSNEKTRLVLRADKNSWILITDSKGVTLFDRTLKAGETYNVPDGKDLHLTTGNAVGLTMLLDGNALPRISNGGKVVRNLSLEPDKLKANRSSKPMAPVPAPVSAPAPASAEPTAPASAPADAAPASGDEELD